MGVVWRLVHAVVALGLIGWLLSIYLERRHEVAQLRATVQQTEERKRAREQDIARTQALIDGLRRDDPLVVEWVARERLQALGPGEIPLPPSPESPR
ncbi:MAG: hypothetical protein RMM29_06505 [Planctomycetota bacterium]|nr:hypothetical protein [Planctomycetota bacterium]MCX8040519.1 hypothetical protein [Planctomycetota bacterium]MDW8373280.1 hypothetical protein [Planctomycetota bacterium]